ncbi:MAG: hypothetical protein AAF986_09040 [Pseudomonadota bacterium]
MNVISFFIANTQTSVSTAGALDLSRQGIISADPTAYIAISWGLSALLLGGLILHALLSDRRPR